MRLEEQEAEVTRREQTIKETEYISPEAQERLENLEKMEAEMKRRAELLKLKLTNLETSAGQQKRNQDNCSRTITRHIQITSNRRWTDYRKGKERKISCQSW